MKYVNGNYYAEVKDHGYRIHPTENIILRKRDLSILSEHSIKFKMKLKIVKIKKLLKTMKN